MVKSADPIDQGAEREQFDTERAILAARNVPFEPGEPGVCDHCEKPSARLVRRACARCRDALGLG
jgi:hypothetical protein